MKRAESRNPWLGTPASHLHSTALRGRVTVLTDGYSSAHMDQIPFASHTYRTSASAPNWRPAEELPGPRDSFFLGERREQGMLSDLRQGQRQGQGQGQVGSIMLAASLLSQADLSVKPPRFA